MTPRIEWIGRGLLFAAVMAGCAAPPPSFVGSAACGSCHADAYAAWETSDHMRAMQLPSQESVLAGFNGEQFDHFGDTYEFIQRDSTFLVVTGGDSLEVAYTFGHYPLQQYLLPTHGGRLQALTVAWDSKDATWYSLYPDEPTPPGDPLHWKSPLLNWNYMCADCHSTGLKRGYDLATDSYETTWEEITVGCEACHGPGGEHSSWAETQKGADPYAAPGREAVVPGVGRSTQAVLESEINMCAACHSRRVPLSESFDHKTAFLDQFAPSLLDDSLYFPDGQIRDEVYVYGSFIQSKMAAKGVSCSDCHDPHSGRTLLPGNALCSSCHEAATYDVALHTGHEPETEAAQCVTCHMPARTYMGVDPRRDHRFGIPDPLMSEETGSPSVCASCHETRSAAWADQKIELLRVAAGKTQKRNRSGAARARVALGNRTSKALELVQEALSDTLLAPIQRASLMAALGSAPDGDAIRMVLGGLQSTSALERIGALRAVSGWAGALPAPNLSSLLVDPVKWVRLEVVAASLAYGRTDWTTPESADALSEYVASQHAVGERPEAHLNLGRMYESLGERAKAEAEFQAALRIDSVAADLWLELALFRGREAGRLRDSNPAAYTAMRQSAEVAFGKAAFQVSPIRSDILYLFGLFLADDPTRMPDAASILKESSRLDPTQARKAYNAGLAYQKMREMDEAEVLLSRARNLGLAEAIDALVILYMQHERWEEADELNNSLLATSPAQTEWLERQAFIRSRM